MRDCMRPIQVTRADVRDPREQGSKPDKSGSSD
jgi:hypothetical protein